MPGSWNYLRPQIKEYLLSNFSRECSVLDVGAGEGTYYNLLHDYFYAIDAVEIFEPYIQSYSLKEKYRNVYNCNIMDFEFNHYDIIILGDVLEKLNREDSIKLIKRLAGKCKELLVILPYNLPQDRYLDNDYEKTLQTDLNDKLMAECFPDLELMEVNGQQLKLRIDVGENVYYYCAFKKRTRPRVVVSLSTVPNRLSHPMQGCGVKPGLDSIINQSYKDFEIHFNIPYYNNKSRELYVIPEWLKEYEKDGKVKIYRTIDYGSATKLIPTVLRLTNDNDIIILVDDDIEYTDGFIEYHLKKRREKYDNCVIGFAGLTSLDGSCHFCTTLSRDTRVKILEGYKTVSYKRSFFKEDFLHEMLNDVGTKTYNDDLLFSAYMGKHNIEKWVVNYEKDTDFKPVVESFPIIRTVPNERGGVNLYRDEKAVVNHDIYYKLGWLER